MLPPSPSLLVVATVGAVITGLMYSSEGLTRAERQAFAAQAQEMFQHGYDSYMKYAFPADELMPLSCRGRIRGVTQSRGEIDDALGRFSLTLVDSLDTLAVMGNLTEFKRAVDLTIKHVSFDRDIIVSTFETNIRMLGGLLGAHAVMLDLQKHTSPAVDSYYMNYRNQLLDLAYDLGKRLLAAFNTTTGLPYSRINLRHGVDRVVRANTATCTACAGTMIIEFAALSRFTNDSSFENAARRALEFLWQQRHEVTHLVGTTINITSGEWLRHESGVGAGIDSYYEYLFKAFILLGEKTYLDVFHTHYRSILKYLRRGPFLIDVHWSRPSRPIRKFMDALQMFFPGLQVLYGDVHDAQQLHNMYFDILQRHKFTPESFTVDHEVVWANSPLRPEFAESTYMLYKATGDSLYLEIGQYILRNIQDYTRVQCGFASLKDVRTLQLEDQMDSFVLAETFKYLYLLFADQTVLPIDIDAYIFTTEAHLIPLSIADIKLDLAPFGSHRRSISSFELSTCPARNAQLQTYLRLFRYSETQPVCKKYHADQLHDKVTTTTTSSSSSPPVVAPEDLDFTNQLHIQYLEFLGIIVQPIKDAVRLVYYPEQGSDSSKARAFLRKLSAVMRVNEAGNRDRTGQLVNVSAKQDNRVISARGSKAAFGPDTFEMLSSLQGVAVITVPEDACTELVAPINDLNGNIAVVRRGGCLFIEKVLNCQKLGASAVIVFNDEEEQHLITMQDDGNKERVVNIPSGSWL
eukprot:gene9159-1451_t